MDKIHPFLAGCIFISNWIVALLFARFYRRTHDRFFIVFALAFAILGLNSLLFIFLSTDNIGDPYLYCIRLIAFLCIIIAILDKNRKSPTI